MKPLLRDFLELTLNFIFPFGNRDVKHPFATMTSFPRTKFEILGIFSL
jgi:hypothetical protein